MITGINGQDGSYLAKFLVESGFDVIGTTRNIQQKMVNLEKLKILDEVRILELDLLDFLSVQKLIDLESPEYIYGLASQSSVLSSFQAPRKSIESISLSTLNILETLRLANSKTRFYNASSSEIFGDVVDRASEESAFSPKSPYAIAKLASQQLTDLYRNSFGVNAVSGILFNHESPLRQENFFTKKVVRAACMIKRGELSKLSLGRIDGIRDWGWAPDFVRAMHAINTSHSLENYVVATGVGKSLQDFVLLTFEILGLDWENYVEIEQENFRLSDIRRSVGDPTKAERNLGWRSSTPFESLILQLIEAEL